MKAVLEDDIKRCMTIVRLGLPGASEGFVRPWRLTKYPWSDTLDDMKLWSFWMLQDA